MGSVAECELRQADTVRHFFHRPANSTLTPGTRVMIGLRVLLFAAFSAMTFASCKPTSTATPLVAREWHSWVLPPDGAMLPTPRSLAVGRGNEILALDTAGRVLVYDTTGVLQRQWKMLDVSVGKPEGIVVLKDGRVIVCDTHYHRIVTFDSDGHWLANFGSHGEGPGEFIYPVAITADAAENLYICEYGGNDRIQKFTRDGKWLAAFGSFGTAPGQFQRPSGITWHNGKLYVADAINNRVLIFSDAGQFLGLLGPPEKPLVFGLPYDITVGPDGVLNIIEYGAGRLSRVTLDGQLLGQLGQSGSGTGEFATPWGIIVDSQGRILVADTKNRRIVTFRL